MIHKMKFNDNKQVSKVLKESKRIPESKKIKTFLK